MIIYQNVIDLIYKDPLLSRPSPKMKKLGSLEVSSPTAQILAKKIVTDKLMHWKHKN